MPPSTFTGQNFKKRRPFRFGVFVDIWSMIKAFKNDTGLGLLKSLVPSYGVSERAESVSVNLLRSLEESIPSLAGRYTAIYTATQFPYPPARLHYRLAESIPGIHKRLQIRTQRTHENGAGLIDDGLRHYWSRGGGSRGWGGG